MVTKIFGCDSLTADIMVPFHYRTREDIETIAEQRHNPNLKAKYHDIDEVTNPNLKKAYNNIAAFIKRMQEVHGTEPFKKIYLSKEEFNELCGIAMPLPTGGTHPGGSSGNTLSAVSQLLGDAVNVSFTSVVGRGPHANCVRGGMKNAGITLHEPPEIPGNPPETAITFNIDEPGGRTALVYPGNIGAILKPEIIEQQVRDSDVTFIQGAYFEKAGRKRPEEGRSTPDHMMHTRWHADKEVWLALPTQEKFSKTMTANDYRYLITSSDLILGNDQELKNVYETGDLNEAMKRLQLDMEKRDDIRQKDQRIRFEHEPVAFITCGGDGAYVIPKSGEPIHVGVVAKEGKNLLGAGDASFGGFIVGRKGGLTLKESGELGMQLAAAKMEVPETRLSDPAFALETYSERSRELYGKVRRNLAALKSRELQQSNGFIASTQLSQTGTSLHL